MFFFAPIKEQWKHTDETSYNNSQSSSLKDARAQKKSPSFISTFSLDVHSKIVLSSCLATEKHEG